MIKKERAQIGEIVSGPQVLRGIMEMEMLGAVGVPMSDNGKTLLNQFCQKFCKRPIAKTDISYVSQKYGAEWQSTVTLLCLAEAGAETAPEFAGELAGTQKEAEQNAAGQALAAYGDQVTLILAQPKSKNNSNKNKRPAGVAGLTDFGAELSGEPDAKVPRTDGPAGNAMSDLNVAVSRITKQPQQKGAISYNTVMSPGLGYSSTCTLPVYMPAEWAGMAFQGEFFRDKKNAELSAALIAYSSMMNDPSLGSIIQTPAVKKQWTGNGKSDGKGKFGKGGGKGKGKFKGYDKGFGKGDFGKGGFGDGFPPGQYDMGTLSGVTSMGFS